MTTNICFSDKEMDYLYMKHRLIGESPQEYKLRFKRHNKKHAMDEGEYAPEDKILR